jgi:hypothetical protein
MNQGLFCPYCGDIKLEGYHYHITLNGRDVICTECLNICLIAVDSFGFLVLKKSCIKCLNNFVEVSPIMNIEGSFLEKDEGYCKECYLESIEEHKTGLINFLQKDEEVMI